MEGIRPLYGPSNAAAFADWSEPASGADLEASRAVLEQEPFRPWRALQAFLPLMSAQHCRYVPSQPGGSLRDPRFGLADRLVGAAASYGISKAAVNAADLVPC